MRCVTQKLLPRGHPRASGTHSIQLSSITMALWQSCRGLGERSWRCLMPLAAEVWPAGCWDQMTGSLSGSSARHGSSISEGLQAAPGQAPHQAAREQQQHLPSTVLSALTPQHQTRHRSVAQHRCFSTSQTQPTPGTSTELVQGSPSDAADPQEPVDPIKAELLSILSQPLPLGRVRNSALNDAAIELGGSYFLDPQKTLQSTIRAFFVIKQVLRSNGHVCIVNSNPSFTPLMQYAAQHCLNSNIWWDWDAYTPGSLLKHPACLMSAAAQPARGIMSSKGLALTNVHCPEQGVMEKPMPQLPTLDKWRLWSTGRVTTTGLRGRQLLRRVVEAEMQAGQLLLPGAGNQLHAPTLIVVLDLSHGQEVVADAHEAGIMTASVVNAHNELDRITYPIYAAEAHPAYTHFFLNWLLKIANVPPPALPSETPRA